MKKKFLVGLLVLTMLVACVAVSASATSGALGSNTNPCTTAQDVATILGTDKVEVNGNTVKLKSNITNIGDVRIKAPDLILDLDTYSITLNSDCTLIFTADATITGKESGKITQAGGTQYWTIQVSDGTLTLAGGTITAATGSADCVMVDGGSASFKMTGGKIEGTQLCVQAQGGASINIEDGTIERTGAQNPKAPEAAVGVMSGSKLNMSGGTVIGKESAFDIQCGVEKTEPLKYYDDGGKVTVTGGTIVSKTADTAAVYVTNKGNFTMTGGTIDAAGVGLNVGVTQGTKNSEQLKATAEIGGTAKINCKADAEGVGEVEVSEYGELTITDSAEIKGGVTVFNHAALKVSGNSKINGFGRGISTNGSESKDAVITITGGTITGSDTTCGVYLPAGKLTVSGDDTVISGGAGIVARGGTLKVQGGTIKATSTEPVTVGDAKGADGKEYPVPPAAVVVDKNESYNDGENDTQLTGGNFKAADEELPAVTFTENGGEPEEGTEVGLTVSGGYYSSSVNESYLDNTIKAEVQSSKGFSYYNSNAAAEKAAEELEGANPPKTLANADKSANIVAAGLMTEKNDDFLNGLAKLVKASGTWATPVADSVDNTFYVVFKAATEDKTSGATYCLEFICNGQTYKTESISNVTEGGIFYFTPTMAGLTAEDFQGDFTINLYKDSVSPDNLVTTYKDTVYRVDYVASTGVKGEKKHIYVDAAHLEEALNNTPGSFTLLPDMNKWTYGLEKSKDGLAYTVKIGGVYASPIDPGHKCPTKGFKDMEVYDTGKLWYHEAMDYMVLNGYIQGFPGNTLQPDGTATRAQLWVIMAQTKGVAVDGDPWYAAAAKWASDPKRQYSDGQRPNDYIQREEIVAILWRMADKPDSKASLSGFGDAASVNDWAKTAMAWAVEKDIIRGRTDANGKPVLVPQGIATRAELAVLIYNYVTLMK